MQPLLVRLFLVCFAFTEMNSTYKSASKIFTVVILPDTQYYTYKFLGNKTYDAQMNWIVDNKDAANIKFVIHMGDMTHHDKHEEWRIARNAHSILDNARIPYSVTQGNHDNTPTLTKTGGGTVKNPSKFNSYFGPQWFERTETEHWYGGHHGSTNENNYCFFESEGLRFMVLTLEFAPSKEALCWANRIIKRHYDRRVIIVTHCYQTNEGGFRTDCSKDNHLIAGSGSTIWHELAKRHNNIFMVLSGHINDSEYHVRRNDAKLNVHEVLTDYQMELWDESDADSKYGNGWMRTLTFDPDNNKINVKSFSVLKDANNQPIKKLNQDDYNSNPADQDHTYPITYDMTSPMPTYLESNNYFEFDDMTINSNDERQQLRPSVAVAKNGDFVTVWEDDSRGAEGIYQIYARGFYKGGCEKFPAKTVNMDNRGQQIRPSIDMADDGSFVVVWQDDANENGWYQIKAASFNEFGQKKYKDFTVNTDPNRQQRNPDISVAPNGEFVVVWEDDSKGGIGTYQIYGRGFNADQSQRFPTVTINGDANGQQLKPVVAIASDASFVVAWEDDRDGNGQYQIRAARFNRDAAKKGNDFTVNSDETRQQKNAAIASSEEGQFVVAWEDDSKGTADIYQIYMRGFKADGSQLFADKVVNTNASGQQFNPAISMHSNGDFVVAWEDDSSGEDGKYQIYARGFTRDGNQFWASRTINQDAGGQQLKPDIGIDKDGDFVIVWEDDANSNSKYQIVGRGIKKNGPM
jgi:hypothetical protein